MSASLKSLTSSAIPYFIINSPQMKTNNQWYPYPDDGSYYKLEDGELFQSAKRYKLAMNRAAASVQAEDNEVLLPGAPHRSETRVDLLGT